VVVEGERVGLDRAGAVVDAGDRPRVDLVPEVGALGMAARDDRVGEGLEGGVGRHRQRQRLPGRRIRRDQVARGRRHERPEPEQPRAAQEAAPG
jgi:hypothetical protein